MKQKSKWTHKKQKENCKNQNAKSKFKIAVQTTEEQIVKRRKKQKGEHKKQKRNCEKPIINKKRKTQN